MSQRVPVTRGLCPVCRKFRVLSPDTGLCLPCENLYLKDKLAQTECQLCACVREKAALMLRAQDIEVKNGD